MNETELLGFFKTSLSVAGRKFVLPAIPQPATSFVN